MKDAISRDVMRDFSAAAIGVASTTITMVEAPPIRIAGEGDHQPLP